MTEQDEINNTPSTEDSSENHGKTIDVFSNNNPDQSRASSSGEERDLTPVQEADIAWRKKETELANIKIQTFKRLKKGIYPLYILLGILITVLAIFWGYNINNIAEPIGGIKADIQNLKKYNDEDVKPAVSKINAIEIRLQYEERGNIQKGSQ